MKIGFIGAGNMGGSILNGMLRSGGFQQEDILVSRLHPEAGAAWQAQGIRVFCDNRRLAGEADCVVMAVKPRYAAGILANIRDLLENKLVISVMGGWSYEMLAAALPESAHFVLAMPNTPMAVGAGLSLLCRRSRCTEEEFALAHSIFAAGGAVVEVADEKIYTAANGISGCGPAFACMFMEALADGGVRCGVPREMAYQLAAQMVIGTGKMLLETGTHPGALKDAVCSPGGATIEGVLALEKGGMRAAVIEAVGAAVEKTLVMGK